MNYKAMQNDISTGGSKEGDAGERGVHAFRLHVLNHTSPLKPKTNSSSLKRDIEGQWKRGGGISFCLSVCCLGKLGGETGETKAAAGNLLCTKPFLKSQRGWLVEQWAETPAVLSRDRLSQAV